MPTSNSTCSPESAAPQDRTVIFKAFSWHHRAQRLAPLALDGGRVAEFAGGVRDVVSGIRNVLEIIERDSIDADCAGENGQTSPAILGIQETANLTRLAIWALARLEVESADMVSYVDSAAKRTAAS